MSFPWCPLRNQLFPHVFPHLSVSFQASVMAKYLVDAKIAVDPRWFLWWKKKRWAQRHLDVLEDHPSGCKWLVTPIYKPFRPFIRGITPFRGLTNHGY